MGFGGISIWQLLIILAIVVLIFGTKKLKSMGSDVGGAMKNFKQAMNSDESDEEAGDGDPQRVGKDETGDAGSSDDDSGNDSGNSSGTRN